jgi:hypothetical protein
MSVELPVTQYLSAQPGMLDWGGNLMPALGGPEQRINRLGNRSILTITVDPETEYEARILLQRLLRAKSEGALMPWPQSGLKVGSPGSPLVNGPVTGGTSIPLKGLTPHYSIREGQPFSIIIGGRRYLHFSDGQVVADAAGNAAVVVTPMLRKPLLGNEVVELAKPMLEGALVGDTMAWDIAAHGHEPFTFTIREMA